MDAKNQVDWSPSASWEMLEKRALLLKQLRVFFEQRGVLEVEVPSLSPYTVTDVQLTPLELANSPAQYLQTSPEYYLKRLISAHPRCVYSLAKAYRSDEAGPKHRAEFTLLEWYRMGYDDRRLMDEVVALLGYLQADLECSVKSYKQLFRERFGINPHTSTLEQLQGLTRQHTTFEGELTSCSDYLDLLFSFCIEPGLSQGATLVSDYPQCQSALARLGENAEGDVVAKRFEVFCHGIEIGNGYWELTDPQLQLERFNNDNQERLRRGLPQRQIDPKFMAALQHGMPACAGIAIGVDRLLMSLSRQKDLADVISFANQ